MKQFTLSAMLCALSASSVVCASFADQILDIDASTLTDFKPSSASGVQDILPIVEHRGVNIDGSVRAGSTRGFRMNGNPFGESWNRNLMFSGVRLDVGSFVINDVDIALPATVPWIIGRSYNALQETSGGTSRNSAGYQGVNWFQNSQPELVFYDSTDAEDRIYLVYGADRFIEFKRVQTGSDPDTYSADTFRATNGAAGMIEVSTNVSAPDIATYYDQIGNQHAFFWIGDADIDDAKEGQFWKTTNPAGDIAYVGSSSNASTALSSYNSAGAITTAYDSAGRRYTYTYTSGQLTRVLAEKNDGGWSEVGRVDYSYYVDADTYGGDNDLKLVTITTPLSDAGVSSERKTYYRYYEGTFHATNNPGYPHQIEYVFAPEGYRNYDYNGAADSSLDDDPLTASEGDLKPYASAHFKYDVDRRVTSTWFNGQCGCSGSANGEYTFTYETNGSYSDGSGYDTAWKSRTIVDFPDVTYKTSEGAIDSYLTVYFDEASQPLHSVRTSLTPSNTTGSQETWATKVTRDSTGRVTEIATPAAVTAYTHTTGSLTASASAGLVRHKVRFSTGDMTGFVEHTKWSEGTGGSEYFDGTIELTSASMTVGDFDVVRPLTASSRSYTEEVMSGTSGSNLTSMSYTYHTGNAALMPKVITSTKPTVSIGNNGPGIATIRREFQRANGTTAFVETTDGIFTYSQIEEGVAKKVIVDAQTNHASDFASGDDPNTDFGITETSAGMRQVSPVTYDDQGRREMLTKADGRNYMTYVSKLADGRIVTLSYSDYDASPLKFYGPVSYSVTNHAGKVEASGIVALTNNETISALPTHVDETDDDPITALDLGIVAQLSTTQYDETGASVQTSRAYFDIPVSGVGVDGTNYDESAVFYDEQGRTVREVDATGTIRRSDFDALGRSVVQWVGTNDADFDEGSSSGTDNMTKISAVEYDSGNDGGNSFVTKQTAYVENSDTDKRETTFSHDVRGRTLVVTNPTSPHSFTKYDNLGRAIASASYSSTASINTSTDDPTTEATNRLSLSQTFYNENGQVWKSQRHKIDQSDGSDDDNLQTQTWFDEAGRTIKVQGASLMKYAYDRLGRRTHAFDLANFGNDTTYADADDVDFDVVLVESQTHYESDDSSNVVMSVRIDRLYDDKGLIETKGALDSNADGDAKLLTTANINGRVQISVMDHDRFDRVTDSAQYGQHDDFDGDNWSAPGSYPSLVMHSETTYNDDGTVLETTGYDRVAVRYEYDDLGRRVTQIRNYVNGTPSGANGDDDLHTRWVYTDGLQTKMWVDIDGDNTEDVDDQVTEYTYGTTRGASAGDSKIATGHMLQEVTDPDSGSTTMAYNGQNQLIYRNDPAGNVIEPAYDDAGRELHRKITTLASGFDGAVRRVTTSYDSSGRVSTVGQYDNATPGSGSIVDEVKFSYESWGNIDTFEQDHNSTVGASGSVDDYEISYTYAKATTGRHGIRRTQYTTPGGQNFNYKYLAGAYRHDAEANRVTYIEAPGKVAIATYQYNGLGHVVGTDLDQANVFDHRYSGSTFPALDRHNRVISDTWTKDLATDVDFYDVDVTYEDDGTISVMEDNIWTGRDVSFSHDGLKRLSAAEEGAWSGSAITSKTRKQDWVELDQLSNWDRVTLDLNGDGDTLDSTEYDDDRAHSIINELDQRNYDRDYDTIVDLLNLSHDASGNLTDDAEYYDYSYDAFNRLRKIELRGTSTIVQEFKYNGLGHRIVVDSPTADPVHLVYDERWRVVARYDDTDTDPFEEFLYHNAGANGRGGSSYIDHSVLRDRDTDANGSLDERLFYIHNWRNDVVALVTDSGEQVESVRYSAYGIPFGSYAGDTDNDGDVNGSGATDDTDQISTWIGASAYDVRGDLNLNGVVNIDDLLAALNNAGTVMGWKDLTSSDVANGKGYAGYEFDDTIQRRWSTYHVRHRVMTSNLGRWIQRDPSGYVDGMNRTAYGKGNPVQNIDPSGLMCSACGDTSSPPATLPDGAVPVVIPGEPTTTTPFSLPPFFGPSLCGQNRGVVESTENGGIKTCEGACFIGNHGREVLFGKTFCLDDGRALICYCTNGMQGWTQDDTAQNILYECTRRHEWVHISQYNCDPSKPNVRQWCPPWDNENCHECQAYLFSTWPCLAEKCGEDFLDNFANPCEACNGNPLCDSAMKEFRDAVFGRITQHCGRCPQWVGEEGVFENVPPEEPVEDEGQPAEQIQ